MGDFASRLVKPTIANRRSICLMGPSGSGKTYQFIKLVEGGLQGLYLHVAGEHLGAVAELEPAPDIFPIKHPAVPLTPQQRNDHPGDLLTAIDHLRSDKHKYDFVFLDGGLAYGELLERYVKYHHKPPLEGFAVWNMYGEMFKMMLLLFTSLTDPALPRPVHAIMTWGVRKDSNWEGKQQWLPITNGNMVPPRIPYYFDDVLVTAKVKDTDNKTQHVLHTQGNAMFDAKLSTKMAADIPETIANPDLAKLIYKITPNNRPSGRKGVGA